MRRRDGRARLVTAIALCAAGALVASCASAARAQHVSAGCDARRAVALTFDDGPNPPYTDQVLRMLRDRGVRATFFVEGAAAAAHPELVAQETLAGMGVGSHSETHSRALARMREGDFARDTARAQAEIAAAAGFAPALYRAPYGHTSTAMLRVLRRAGYTSVGWDVDSRDWSDATADEVVRNVLAGAHPGAIILMHDGGLGGGNPDRSTTLAALPRVIDGLRSAGYEMVTVPELTGLRARQDEPARSATCLAN
ncbi:MAG TPA: polysaccharide deacetylase family protein [Dehalococcoidia bacterium]|nr:polysaccharide deacetylase family protein [Dehalococcoidia bacterium]